MSKAIPTDIFHCSNYKAEEEAISHAAHIMADINVAREFRLYMDFDILTGPLQPENSYA